MEAVLKSLKDNAPPKEVLKSLKRPRAETNSCTLTGGTAQPPRVIGYRRTGAHVDLSFRVEKRVFAAHSQVLAPCCGLIAHLVNTTGFDYRKPIELPNGCKAAALEAVLDFCYDGEVSIGEALLEPVMELAHHLQADSALKSAAILMSVRVTPTTCLAALGLALRLGVASLRVAAEQSIRQHFDSVRQQRRFGEVLPEEMIRALLTDEDLPISREESAFEAAIAWISAQTPTPSESTVGSLLRLVRFASLPRSYVVNEVIPHPLLRTLPGGAPTVLLNAFMDAHYGAATALCKPRSNVAAAAAATVQESERLTTERHSAPESCLSGSNLGACANGVSLKARRCSLRGDAAGLSKEPDAVTTSRI